MDFVDFDFALFTNFDPFDLNSLNDSPLLSTLDAVSVENLFADLDDDFDSLETLDFASFPALLNKNGPSVTSDEGGGDGPPVVAAGRSSLIATGNAGLSVTMNRVVDLDAFVFDLLALLLFARRWRRIV